jgi:hypothetical protein
MPSFSSENATFYPFSSSSITHEHELCLATRPVKSNSPLNSGSLIQRTLGKVGRLLGWD